MTLKKSYLLSAVSYLLALVSAPAVQFAYPPGSGSGGGAGSVLTNNTVAAVVANFYTNTTPHWIEGEARLGTSTAGLIQASVTNSDNSLFFQYQAMVSTAGASSNTISFKVPPGGWWKFIGLTTTATDGSQQLLYMATNGSVSYAASAGTAADTTGITRLYSSIASTTFTPVSSGFGDPDANATWTVAVTNAGSDGQGFAKFTSGTTSYLLFYNLPDISALGFQVGPVQGWCITDANTNNGAAATRLYDSGGSANVENIRWRDADDGLDGAAPGGVVQLVRTYTTNAITTSFVGSKTNSTVYLSPYGDDRLAFRGLSERPWKTWQFAVTNLQSGDSLNIAPGTYEAGGHVWRPTNITVHAEGADVIFDSSGIPIVPVGRLEMYYGNFSNRNEIGNLMDCTLLTNLVTHDTWIHGGTDIIVGTVPVNARYQANGGRWSTFWDMFTPSGGADARIDFNNVRFEWIPGYAIWLDGSYPSLIGSWWSGTGIKYRNVNGCFFYCPTNFTAASAGITDQGGGIVTVVGTSMDVPTNYTHLVKVAGSGSITTDRPYDRMTGKINYFGGNPVITSNAVSSWPTIPRYYGDAYWGNSNGVVYLLTSGVGLTWTATNKIAP